MTRRNPTVACDPRYRQQGNKRASRAMKPIDRLIIILVAALLIWAFAPGVGADLLQLGRPGDDSFISTKQQEAALRQAPKTDLIEAVKKLKVSDMDQTPYSRDLFGPAWADTDHNGCDTRNDILARDLDQVTYRAGTHDCVVTSGTMTEPYTGAQVTFEKGPRSADVQIDHVVALANAWRTGAAQWDDAKRTEFANDPLNLLAVDGAANQDKEAKSADQWLPPNKEYHCAYVARQVAVKTKWDLWVTQREKNAIISVATTCPEQPLPTN